MTDERACCHRNTTGREKNLDLIVANDVSERGAGFESLSNRVTVLGPGGLVLPLGPTPKRERAAGIWDAIAAQLPIGDRPSRGEVSP